MPDYAVIIPAYNEEALLAGTIAATRAAMAEMSSTGELIVVDNNSTDATAEIAEECGADRVVFEPHNQIARARNAGAAATDVELLVFIDADTQVPAAVLRQALDDLVSGEWVGGGALVTADQPVSKMVGWLIRTWNTVAEKFGYAAGSFFYARRDGFDAVGGFDEAVYAGEEVWLAKRLKKWGKKHGLGFRVIVDHELVTSGRKSDWFTDWDFVRQLGIFFLFPWATRSRRLCSMWYKRPS